MKGVTSIAELRKRMRLTGAEVLPKKIHKCEDLLLISDRQHQGWSEQLHLGGPLRHRRRCQVRSATCDYLWYLSISTFYQGARHHLLDLPRRGRRHGVLEGDKIISIFAEEASRLPTRWASPTRDLWCLRGLAPTTPSSAPR